jgi:hypothetical protein
MEDCKHNETPDGRQKSAIDTMTLRSSILAYKKEAAQLKLDPSVSPQFCGMKERFGAFAHYFGRGRAPK